NDMRLKLMALKQELGNQPLFLQVAFFLLRCVVAPLRETFFLLFSQCGLTLPLCEDFLPHAKAQRRNVNSGKRKAYCGLCGTGHHSAQYAEYRYCALPRSTLRLILLHP
ncbi:MAG: hypothetical protein WCI11_17830, partial [Candidatus Methylumidiphilus sp.]